MESTAEVTIELCKTAIITVRNMNRVVQVTHLLPYTCHHGAAKEMVLCGPAYLLHIKPSKPCDVFDLGNLINAALRICGNIRETFQKHLLRRTRPGKKCMRQTAK